MNRGYSDKICDALFPDTFQVSGSLAFLTRLKKTNF